MFSKRHYDWRLMFLTLKDLMKQPYLLVNI